jgi:excisionase family DNA binding protein
MPKIAHQVSKSIEGYYHDLRVRGACGSNRKAHVIVDKPPQRKRAAPTNGLLTLIEAAARLGISVKTLRAHVVAGSIRYIAVGRGAQRTRRMFAPTDLDDFIATQTRRDVP